jgi:hypothetical protein
MTSAPPFFLFATDRQGKEQGPLWISYRLQGIFEAAVSLKIDRICSLEIDSNLSLFFFDSKTQMRSDSTLGTTADTDNDRNDRKLTTNAVDGNKR